MGYSLGMQNSPYGQGQGYNGVPFGYLGSLLGGNGLQKGMGMSPYHQGNPLGMNTVSPIFGGSNQAAQPQPNPGAASTLSPIAMFLSQMQQPQSPQTPQATQGGAMGSLPPTGPGLLMQRMTPTG